MVKNRTSGNPVTFPLTAGEHIIKIKLREAGTKLDRLLLTNDVELVPRDKGNPAKGESPPNQKSSFK